MHFRKILSVLSTTVITIIFTAVIIVSIVAAVLVFYLSGIMKNTETINIENTSFKTPSCIYTLNSDTGKYDLIYKHLEENNDIQIKTDISKIPEYVSDAFICTEDERFYRHQGVDYRRTFSALLNEFTNIYGETHGGSTITQQLIKNITGDNETTWDRKLREICRAIKLEKKYTKDEIMNAYLNTIYFGQDNNGCNMYGIEAASLGYFGKNSSQLTVAEAASLAAVPKNPYYENPISNYKLNQERKCYSLKKMFELGKLSSEQYETAMAEEVLVVGTNDFQKNHPDYTLNNEFQSNTESINSWTVDTAIYEFCDYLEDTFNYSEERALKEFYDGGYALYITADKNIQGELEKNYADLTYFPKETDENGENIQSAFVVIDYYGQILGICGAIGNKDSSLCWNNATMTHRQPGSTIKPVTTYGYGIENNLITWSSIFTDAPLEAGTVTDELWPENYSNYWSYKPNTINFFLKKSYNTVPAQLCRKFGHHNIYEFACENMHLELDPEYDDDYAPLSVGATNQGPDLLNLTNSYLPYGNGGKYYKAHIISRAVDTSAGKILFEHNASEFEQAVSSETAYIMNKLLRNVISPLQSDGEYGTGISADLPHKTVAGKTGTTQNWRDIDFIGMTEDFVSGIWIGYPNGENPEAIQNTKSATVWKNVFGNFADSYSSDAHYPECPGIKEAYYCTVSGLLAGANCPRSKEKGYYPTNYCEYCNIH